MKVEDVKNISDIMKKGLVLIVDDKVGVEDSSDRVNAIVTSLEQTSLLLIKLRNIPEQKTESFANLAFIILDWELNLDIPDAPAGVNLKQDVKTVDKGEIIKFIDEISNKYFIPIFIFTGRSNKEIEDIKKDIVNTSSFYSETNIEESNLFIKNKEELLEEGVFEVFDQWLVENPAIYLMKEYENTFYKSIHNFYRSMVESHKSWPIVAYNTILEDNIEPLPAMKEFLSKCITAHSGDFSFNKDFFSIEPTDQIEQLQKIWENMKFITYSEEYLENVESQTSGDIYVFNGEGGASKRRYLINITPVCNTRNGKMLYLLGKRKNKTEEDGLHNGSIIDRANEKTIPNLLDQKFISFDFTKFNVFLFDEGSNFNKVTIQKRTTKRVDGKPVVQLDNQEYVLVGRLMEPYLSTLQRANSNYISRIGTPRLPKVS
ncbi:hypothetical protein KHQ82_05425 [Mycoplasmatota bacterium]|nr:hypothetical protein KHQ82_05425 [Mycoplasmatota bacterium]